MTEEQWLNSEDLESMGWFLAAKGNRRKVALFACACCRQLWDELKSDEIRACLAAAERCADGAIRPRTAGVWWRRACTARAKALASPHSTAERIAHDCVVKAVVSPEQGYVHGQIVDGILARTGVYSAVDERLREREAITRRVVVLLRDVAGNPFRPPIFAASCLNNTVRSLAGTAYDDRLLPSGHLDTMRLAVLSDAIEEAGGGSEILTHLRDPGPHVRGCWALDAILGRS